MHQRLAARRCWHDHGAHIATEVFKIVQHLVDRIGIQGHDACDGFRKVEFSAPSQFEQEW